MVIPANADALIAATRLAMNNIEPVVSMDGAKNFADLTALLKVAKKDDILAAYQQVKNGAAFTDTELAEYVNKMRIIKLLQIIIIHKILCLYTGQFT